MTSSVGQPQGTHFFKTTQLFKPDPRRHVLKEGELLGEEHL